MDHFITKRIVDIPADDIVVLLSQENPYCAKFSDDTANTLDAMGNGKGRLGKGRLGKGIRLLVYPIERTLSSEVYF